jgi:hypothetical protein
MAGHDCGGGAIGMAQHEGNAKRRQHGPDRARCSPYTMAGGRLQGHGFSFLLFLFFFLI